MKVTPHAGRSSKVLVHCITCRGETFVEIIKTEPRKPNHVHHCPLCGQKNDRLLLHLEDWEDFPRAIERGITAVNGNEQ